MIVRWEFRSPRTAAIPPLSSRSDNGLGCPPLAEQGYSGLVFVLASVEWDWIGLGGRGTRNLRTPCGDSHSYG
jgi:hypothetical protein